MTLLDDKCDGCGAVFDMMGDPLIHRAPTPESPYAVRCDSCHTGDWAKRSERFHAVADETDDALDHDMLHAAGVISTRGWPADRYVARWLDHLWERFVVPFERTGEEIREALLEDAICEGYDPVTGAYDPNER